MKETASDNLHTRIERYFNCRLTDEEERKLMQELALMLEEDPVIRSAKAVMGFRSGGSAQSSSLKYGVTKERTGRSLKRIGRVLINSAAAVALLLGGCWIYREVKVSDKDTTCIAYLNGTKVTAEEEVLQILRANLMELDEGAVDMESALADDLEDILVNELL